MYVEDYVTRFAHHLIVARVPEMLFINRQGFILIHGVKKSINNQGGTLQEENLLGRNLKYAFISGSLYIPMSIQLFINGWDHFRVFSFSDRGMLFSINLSTGYEDGIVLLKQQNFQQEVCQ